jgi:hypothetical protein
MARSANQAIESYVTDMLSLEQHIRNAIRGQIADLDDDHPDVARQLQAIASVADAHIAALQPVADRRGDAGQGIAEAIKRAGSAILGVGAAAVDLVRNEKLPKDLRDDYTAVNLACIGYVMLYTTASSLGDREVADLSYRHLRAHARNVMVLHNLVPGAVIRFLQHEGLPARADVLTEVAKNIDSVWTDQSDTVPDADQTTTASRAGTTGFADRTPPDAPGRA